MKDRKQINKIAKSVFNAAIKAKTVEKTGNDLGYMAALLKNNPDVSHFFSDIFQPIERHLDVLQNIADKATFDKLSLAYITHLQQIRHLDWVTWVADYYLRLADDYLGQEHATVITPFPLQPKDKQTLTETLSAMTGKKIFLREEILRSSFSKTGQLFENKWQPMILKQVAWH